MPGSATWERGREATKPNQIPVKGWKDTLLRVKDGISEDRLSMISAAMAYYALFAFIPALSSVVLIYAWVSDPAQISEHLNKVSHILPSEIQQMLKEQLGTLASAPTTKLGFGALFSLVLTLYSASKGSLATMDGLNIIYDEKEERGFIQQNLMAIGMTFIAAIIGLLAIAAIVIVPAVANFIGWPAGLEIAVSAASWIILLALFSLFLAIIYRFGPHREKPQWKWVSVGAIVASVGFVLSSALFSWYASEFGNFNKTYGSMGAVIVLMMWFYISSFVILLGGEINAELEHQTAQDTTSGHPRPLGTRGATMADSVGEAKSN
jgi:membrane protein